MNGLKATKSYSDSRYDEDMRRTRERDEVELGIICPYLHL